MFLQVGFRGKDETLQALGSRFSKFCFEHRSCTTKGAHGSLSVTNFKSDAWYDSPSHFPRVC